MTTRSLLKHQTGLPGEGIQRPLDANLGNSLMFFINIVVCLVRLFSQFTSDEKDGELSTTGPLIDCWFEYQISLGAFASRLHLNASSSTDVIAASQLPVIEGNAEKENCYIRVI